MRAPSHTAAAARVADALAGCSVPVHTLPMTDRPVIAPCVLVGTPEANDHTAVGCGTPYWSFTVDLVVIADTTRAVGLLGLVDEVATLLDTAALPTTSRATTYDLPNHPAGLPAVTLTVD